MGYHTLKSSLIQLNEPKRQNPDQGLPDQGPAVPSEVTATEGDVLAMAERKNPRTTAPPRNAKSEDWQAELQGRQKLIQEVKDFAYELVCDSGVQDQDWPFHLRSHKSVINNSFKDADLDRILAEAKNRRDGRMPFIAAGSKLNTRPIPWIWEGVIMANAVNLVYAAPKCGKTRLILGLVASVGNSAKTFLGRPITSTRKKVLILGPDMPEVVWADMLKEYRLMDETDHLHPCITALTCSGMRFALDEEGIQMVEDQAMKNRGLIIILDCYQRAIAPLGLDENRAEAAVPLTKLMEAVAPYEATVIVIHHANKQGATGSMSSAARGTTALTAVPDQLISMKPFMGDGDNRERKEIELTTEGRGGKPVALLLELEEDGRTWVSLGSPSERRQKDSDQKMLAEMSDKQSAVLGLLMQAFEATVDGLTVREMVDGLGLEGQKGAWDVKQRVEALENKKLLSKTPEGRITTGRPANVYVPSAKALAMFRRKE